MSGVTANIAARVAQHRIGAGSDFCCRYGLVRLVWTGFSPNIVDCIAHEKRVQRWRREWKFALIEEGNPDWRDLSGDLV